MSSAADPLRGAAPRRLILRVVLLTVGCLAAATAGRGLILLVRAAPTGAPVAWADALPGDANDLYLPLFLAAILGIELVQNGWHDSALRRLVGKTDASTRTDLFYCAMALTRLAPVIGTVLTLGLSAKLKELEIGHGLSLCADLPLCLAVPGVLLVQSFCGYWLHRLMHTPLFWPLHAVHHAAGDFNVITALRHHPLDGIIGTLALPIAPALLGFPIEAITIVVLGVSAYTIYLHSELPCPSLLERFIAFGPRGHGIHHGRDRRCRDANFGDLVIWDRLFGTCNMNVAGKLGYGCDGPDSLYQSGRPLRDMVAVQLAWLRGLGRALDARPAAAALRRNDRSNRAAGRVSEA